MSHGWITCYWEYINKGVHSLKHRSIFASISQVTNASPVRRQAITLRWRHNDHAGVSNHQPHGCLLNRLFRRKSKKTSKLRVTGLCAGNSPGTGEFPAQMASYAENASIWWRHHDLNQWWFIAKGTPNNKLQRYWNQNTNTFSLVTCFRKCRLQHSCQVIQSECVRHCFYTGSICLHYPRRPPSIPPPSSQTKPLTDNSCSLLTWCQPMKTHKRPRG